MSEPNNRSRALSRRRFLRLGLGAATAVVAAPVLARPQPVVGERSLALYNLHTGESLRTIYWEQGDYLLDALHEVSHLMRDFRTGEVRPISPQLLDLLHRLHRNMGGRQPFHLISGYRSPHTNALLRSESSGVAKHSLHMKGEAADIRLPGRSLKQLHQAAVALKGGGVGYYPQSDFIHVDVGRVRYW